MSAQEGHHGDGHEQWHHDFYHGLKRPDYPGASCCNMNDCRPTSMRTHDGRYQIKIGGQWVDVPMNLVVKRTAPDHGTHVCASRTGTIFCVVLPPET